MRRIVLAFSSTFAEMLHRASLGEHVPVVGIPPSSCCALIELLHGVPR